MKANKLEAIFIDTKNIYSDHEILKEAINHTIDNTLLYDEVANIPYVPTQKEGLIEVSKERSFECARRLIKEYPNKKVAVLNFASAINPGGGVEFGAKAQEECLCRTSTLYPALSTKYLWDNYYGANRAMYNPLHNDMCIYTPDIIVFKDDITYPTLLDEKDWYKVDIISSAAPDLYNYLKEDYAGEDIDLYNIHLKRGRRIIEVALHNKVDILVLGAFGCGAFANDPYIVSKAYKELMKEYNQYFTEIAFAIYTQEYDTSNYDAFMKELL